MISLFSKPHNSLLDSAILSNEETLKQMIVDVPERINSAKRPVILADFEVTRYRAQKAFAAIR